MKLKNILGLFFLMCLIPSLASAQQKSITQEADNLFDQKQYILAIEKYQKAFSKVKSNRAEKNRITFQMAECYRLTSDLPKAISNYKKLIKAKYYQVEPKTYFYLAECFQFSNDFEEAAYNYDEYLKLVPTDKLAKTRKESLGKIREMVAEKMRYQITNAEKFNSKQNEWSPTFVGTDTNNLVFTSSRDGATGKDKDGWTGQSFSDFFYVYKDRKGNWTAPELFETDNLINTPVNEGEASFSPDGSSMYFTRCDHHKNQAQSCYIYNSSRASSGKRKSAKQEAVAWSEPQRIILGDSVFNYVHPAISSDGLTLYFSSDMSGGEGDMDIWKATRGSLKETFGKPENLGKTINTPGKELYPVLRNDSTLYFSSNGHIGMGSLDIYKSSFSQKKWTPAKNLGYPLNTSYDEIGITFYPTDQGTLIQERGYFSSNRPVAFPHDRDAKKELKSLQKKNINDEIWYFELPPLLYTLQGTVRDEKSMQLVPNARVKLAGSDGKVFETKTNKKGQYFFGDSLIRLDVQYKAYITKMDYFSTNGTISTIGYTTNKDIVQDFRLEPVPTEPVVLPEIRYDLAKWDLKEQYQDSLLDLLMVMRNNPSFVMEIRSHTDCRPFVTLTNDTLSQRRAQSVVDYLVNRGVEPARLVAKGYSDRVPRILDKKTSITYNNKAFDFRKGTTLTCDYIKGLKNKDEEEAAHQLNRRTEFAVLRTDYVSKNSKRDLAGDSLSVEQDTVLNLVPEVAKPKTSAPIIVHNDSVVSLVMIHSTKGEVDCIVNGALMTLLVDEKYRDPIALSWETAMKFLREKRINKEDFPERDNAFDPDGNIIEGSIIRLKSVQIGPRRVMDIEAVVVKNLTHKIIMNRFGLKDFGNYEFNKQSGKLIFKQ